MLGEDRRNEIKKIIIEEKSVEVSNLVKKFNVSEETIRRDLKSLEKKNIVKKTYGGAVLSEEFKNSIEEVPSVNTRKFKNFKEKVAIAKKAVSLISNDSFVLLDAGTTTECIARQFKNIDLNETMSVITNGLNVAEKLSYNEYLSIYLLGGKLRQITLSLVGPKTIKELSSYNIDIAFLGTTGISLNKGCSSSNPYEVEVKKTMVNIAHKVVVVADHTKFNQYGLMSFCDFDNIDLLITSELVPESIRNSLKQHDMDLIICRID